MVILWSKVFKKKKFHLSILRKKFIKFIKIINLEKLKNDAKDVVLLECMMRASSRGWLKIKKEQFNLGSKLCRP